MAKVFVVITLSGIAALTTTFGQAQNLLINGDLNSLTQIGDPNLYYPTPTGWSLTTDPCSEDPCPIIRYPASPQPYADRTMGHNDYAPPFGVLFNPTEGDFPGFPDVIFVDADLKQSVPGTPGQAYKMTGWAYFEGGYAGGVDTIATGTGTTREGLPSLTDTFFALEFLDASNAVLSGSVVIELKEAGQVNNPDLTEQTRNWMQHTLYGVAPPGTVSVQVRASMVDGEFNIDMPHQAAWFDDFSLEAIPEPATWIFGLLGLALASVVRRRK